MTYADQGLTMGQAADNEITQLTTTNANLTTQNNALTAQVADLQAQIAAGQPKPPPTGLISWGSSGLDSGPSSYASINTLLTPKIMRSYDPGGVTSWATCNGAKVPAGVTPFHSAKWSETLVAANDGTTMNQIKDWLNGLGYKCWHHEPEGDFPVATYQSAYKNIVALGVGLARLFPTIMAWTLTPAGQTKWGNPDQFYIPQAGGLGFDAYGQKNGIDLTQFDLAAKYAAGKSKPWIIAELGYHAISSTEANPTDDQLLTFLQAVVARIRTYSNPPLAVSLMNHGAQTMDGTTNPKSTSYWKSVCSGAA